MKKCSAYIFLSIMAAFICVLLGFYVGRSSNQFFFTGTTTSDSFFLADTAPSLPPEQVGKVNINSASAEELMLLPGIGEVLANRIIQEREENGRFNNVDEIVRVSGIGEATLNNIKNYITAED